MSVSSIGITKEKMKPVEVLHHMLGLAASDEIESVVVVYIKKDGSAALNSDVSVTNERAVFLAEVLKKTAMEV